MSTSTPIPKLSALQEVIRSTLASATLFSAAGVAVISNKGTQQKKIEKELRGLGFVVEVMPMLGAKLRDQSGTAYLLDCDFMIRLRCNPERNNATRDGGAGLELGDAIAAVFDALCQRSRHPGGEFFKVAEDAVTLSQIDDGEWIYALMVTKEALL